MEWLEQVRREAKGPNRAGLLQRASQATAVPDPATAADVDQAAETAPAAMAVNAGGEGAGSEGGAGPAALIANTTNIGTCATNPAARQSTVEGVPGSFQASDGTDVATACAASGSTSALGASADAANQLLPQSPAAVPKPPRQEPMSRAAGVGDGGIWPTGAGDSDGEGRAADEVGRGAGRFAGGSVEGLQATAPVMFLERCVGHGVGYSIEVYSVDFA
jgi:hypothetical protein